MMKTANSFLAVSAAILMAACNTAPSNSDHENTDTLSTMEDYSADATPMSGPSDMADTAFVRQAGEGGLSEVALAKLAKEKATDSKIKSFADQMMTDHSKANEKLKSIAEGKGLTVPASLPADKQKLVDEMSSKSGQEFDKAYVKQMVEDHEKTVSLFKSAESSVKDSELNGFVRETLPTLKQHLTHAQKLSN